MMSRMISLALISLNLTLSSCDTCRFDCEVSNFLKNSNYEQCDSCIFELHSVTEFEWDSVYIFNEFVSGEEISEFIGTDCHCFTVDESMERIIFTHNGKIVFSDEYYDISTVQFKSIVPNEYPIHFSKKNAVFHVSRFNLGQMEVYDLLPVSGQ